MTTATTSKTVTLNPEVVSCLHLAVEASNNMLTCCQAAAANAASEIDITKSLADEVERIAAQYKEHFQGNVNVRSNFKDALLLQGAEDSAVSFEKKNSKGEVTEVHTTAKEAANAPRHDMKAAAKAVREDLGIGRKAGGGRKARTPDTKPSAVETDNADIMATKLHNLFDVYMAKPEGIAKLRAELKSRTPAITITIKK